MLFRYIIIKISNFSAKILLIYSLNMARILEKPKITTWYLK